MKQKVDFATNKSLDIICLGRLAVDLYAEQVGSPLESVSSFAKYLGGSSANIAFGCARLGLKSAMLSKVGNEQNGRFLVDTLSAEGCDVSQVKVDPERLTALVMLGLKDKDIFPLIFYRENCADMALEASDIDEAFIASSKALLITGTHFSTAKVFAASQQALKYAKQHQVKTVLDIDYRPVLWGLTSRGDGETRFIANDQVSQHLQSILSQFDLIVGTEEEFMIAGGRTHLIDALHEVRRLTAATLVVKLGPLGCVVIHKAIPKHKEGQTAAEILLTAKECFPYQGVQIEVLNVLGAGDAFMAGFLKGWLNNESDEICCRYANACGALVVSRHACAPAMPTLVELDYFLTNQITQPHKDIYLNRLHRVSVPRQMWPELNVFAFDHRYQFFELSREAGVEESRLSILKCLLVEAVEDTERKLGLQNKIGVLIDDRYGKDALNLSTGRGWWVGRSVELPLSNPLHFDYGRSIGTHLISWPKEQVVKCLVAFHPDDKIENRLEQEAQVKALYDAVQVSGHELLLEIIPPKTLPLHEDTVFRSMQRLYNLGIYPEWWKLEALSPRQWQSIDQLILQRDPYCRGVVLLGLNAPIHRLSEAFQASRYSQACRGFMVGRTIFQEPATLWLQGKIDETVLKHQVSRTFEQLIRLWQQREMAA